MSSTEIEKETFVKRAEFEALVEKVEDGFLDIRRHQCRTDTHMLEIRRELSHHSELLTELKDGQAEHGQILQEHGNMLKQILELVSKPS